eukprot:1735968-Pyramimonas_sp.AAC.1
MSSIELWTSTGLKDACISLSICHKARREMSTLWEHPAKMPLKARKGSETTPFPWHLRGPNWRLRPRNKWVSGYPTAAPTCQSCSGSRAS